MAALIELLLRQWELEKAAEMRPIIIAAESTRRTAEARITKPRATAAQAREGLAAE